MKKSILQVSVFALFSLSVFPAPSVRAEEPTSTSTSSSIQSPPTALGLTEPSPSPSPTPLPNKITVRKNVELKFSGSSSGELIKEGAYQIQGEVKKPETQNPQLGTESGHVKTGTFLFSVQGGRPAWDSPPSDRGISGTFAIEHASGEYQRSPEGETANARVWQIELSRDAMVNETSAKLRFGKQISQGTEHAPVGNLISLPVQIGLSSRYGAYIEAGVGEQEGIESALHARVNLKLEEQLQYCSRLDHAAENALCLSLRANQIIGSQGGGAAGGTIKYTHQISDSESKAYLFVGMDGAIEGLGPIDSSKSVAAAKAGLVAGIATQ